MLYLELPHLSRQIHNRFDSNHIQLDRLQRTFTHTIVRLDPRDKYSNKSWIRGVYFIHLCHLFVESNGGRTVEDHTNLRNQCPEHFLGGRSAKKCQIVASSPSNINCPETLLYVHRYSSCNDFGKLGLKETCVSTFWKMVGSRNGKQISCLIVHIL